MKRWFWITLLAFISGYRTMAQDITDIEKILEANQVERAEDGYEDIVNTLTRLAAFPLNVNTADFDSLKMLFFLSDAQIDNILSFRKRQGKFLHLNELLLVRGIGLQDLENIRPFIFIGELSSREKRDIFHRRFDQEVLAKARINWPLQEGYTKYPPADFKNKDAFLKKQRSRFQGSPVGTLIKYKLRYSSFWQAGFTGENDPGEAYFTRYQKTGFDFLSAYLSYTSDRFVRKLIAGDFRVQWGQGLTAWGGFNSGKSALALGNEKSGRGFSPYTSTDENNFFRGAAVSLQLYRNVSADLFGSYKKTDGNLLEISQLPSEDLLTASLYETGYHRSWNECEKKHTLKEFTAGGALKWNASRFRIGLQALYYNFKPFIHVGDKPYQRYNDDGKERMVASIDYKTGYTGFYFFGETALSEKGAIATVNGLRYSGSSRMALCILYRYYGKKYVSRYASGFGEYSNTSNEEGVYVGVGLSLLKNLKLNVYYDYFRSFAPRYRAFVPGSGQEILTEAVYKHASFEHTFRFKKEDKPEDKQGGLSGKTLRKREEYRYQFAYRIDKSWEVRTRVDGVIYQKSGVRDRGYLIYQDLIYSSRNQKFKTQFRLAYFDTDSYDARIYCYENNVLYGYSFPAYFDRGIRTYLNLNWKPWKFATVYWKMGFTYYPDREFIGSSVTRVDDHKLFDCTLQVRMRF